MDTNLEKLYEEILTQLQDMDKRVTSEMLAAVKGEPQEGKGADRQPDTADASDLMAVCRLISETRSDIAHRIGRFREAYRKEGADADGRAEKAEVRDNPAGNAEQEGTAQNKK